VGAGRSPVVTLQLEHHVMKRFTHRTLAAVTSIVFGAAFSFGAFATNNPFPTPPPLEQNGQCVACHQACDDARQECVANGQGPCFPAFRVCTETCSSSIPGCAIP